ncbi:hypothetical protein Q5692_39640, partial [Microcoleus sp. C2C3]|uniref:hypothetical protein n=1 Tax=unclassified Microcoleus TaxID=2642155 RepID=UPI002FCFBD3B
ALRPIPQELCFLVGWAEEPVLFIFARGLISSGAGFAGTDCTGFLTYNNPPTAQRTIVEIPAIREKRFGF